MNREEVSVSCCLLQKLKPPLLSCGDLLISARLRLICGLSSGGSLPLCHWNFSLHFTPVLLLTFLLPSASHFLLKMWSDMDEGEVDVEGRGAQTMQRLQLLQIRDYIDTYSYTARTIPWISCSPSHPSPTQAHSHAHIHAPCLIKDCASEAVLTSYQL